MLRLAVQGVCQGMHLSFEPGLVNFGGNLTINLTFPGKKPTNPVITYFRGELFRLGLP